MPATIDDKGNATVTCDCGKPIVYSDIHGMFCEDMCGYEESKSAGKILDTLILDVCSKLNIIEVDVSEEEIIQSVKEILENGNSETTM